MVLHSFDDKSLVSPAKDHISCLCLFLYHSHVYMTRELQEIVSGIPKPTMCSKSKLPMVLYISVILQLSKIENIFAGQRIVLRFFYPK